MRHRPIDRLDSPVAAGGGIVRAIPLEIDRADVNGGGQFSSSSDADCVTIATVGVYLGIYWVTPLL